MHRPWTICVALLAIAGCDNTTDASAGTEGGGIDQPRGGYQVAQRCNGLGPASLDLTATDKSNNYRLLVRGGEQEPRYAAVDDLVVGPSWSDDYSTIETAADGLPLYEWRAQLTKEPGWLDDDGTGKKAPRSPMTPTKTYSFSRAVAARTSAPPTMLTGIPNPGWSSAP